MTSVLVIEDELMIQNLLGRLFEMEGYEVLKASDGKKGLDVFREHHADLIITDIIMPEMDGLEVTRTVREEDPDVKIIAISGGGRDAPENYLAMAEIFGANKTFCKPIDRTELLAAARNLLA